MDENPHLVSGCKAADLPPDQLDNVLKSVVDDMIDDIILGECFEIHRECKLRLFDIDSEIENKYRIDLREGLDVFGRLLVKERFKETCDHCKRTMDASCFARHLEEHFGTSRESSRLANQRIKNVAKDESDFAESENSYDGNSQRARRRGERGVNGGGNRIKGKPKSRK